jgi:hypothetical protein
MSIKGIVKQIHKFEDKLNFQTKLNDLKRYYWGLLRFCKWCCY